MQGAVLGKESLLRLLAQTPPLIEGLLNAEEQVQPNGIDLTLKEVAMLCSQGRIGISNEERLLSSTTPLTFDGMGFIDLYPGSYLVTFNEIVHIPKEIMALGRTRSSLLRCGASLHTAVWDAGYEGRSQSLLVVYNSFGLRLARNARIMQLVFILLDKEARQGYNGIFQRENL